MMRLCFLLVWLAAGTAYADDVATYAIVVGSNAGGPGQTDLKYAEDDARRMGQLLTELGGYKSDQVDVIVHPTPDKLRARIDVLGEKVKADHAAGKASRVFFYYSGHARATAIDLGSDQLPLAELRQRLFDLPSKLTVVVLDACQSGAFSRVKGAAPTADFSFNSRQNLDATGVAVLASSTGSELSQESEQLRSSYFTHHLLVGLRGGGDANRDGLVTIDEAYRYAYHQTLLATAETAVGGQHVSLEVDLKGHGEVPLSFPRAATSHIELPAALEGKTLVEDKRSKTVVAETYKAKGAAVRIAVAPGEYRVMVRRGTTLSRCEVSGGGTIDLDRCRTETMVTGSTKGGGWARPYRIEVLGLVGGERDDDYTRTLEAFGYEQDWLTFSSGLAISGLRRVHDNAWVGLSVTYHALPLWTYEATSPSSNGERQFDWSTTVIGAVGRGELPLGASGPRSRIRLYGQLTAGLGIGQTSLHDEVPNMTRDDTYFGPAVSLAGGIQFAGDDNNARLKGFGVSFGYQLDYAPVIKNLVGDTHATGGHRPTFALIYAF